jgi:hypothetical protein
MSVLNMLLVNKSKEVFKKCIFVNIVTLNKYIFSFSTNNVLFENLIDQNKIKIRNIKQCDNL